MEATIVCVTESKKDLHGCGSTNGCYPCDE